MSNRGFMDFEIVGFDGNVIVECEMVLPLARHKSTDVYFKLTKDALVESHYGNAPYVSQPQFTRAEINARLEEGRLTLLPRPFPAFQGAMIAYFDSEFLESTEKELPEGFYRQCLSDDVLVVCGTQDRVESLMNLWANQIMNSSTLQLEQYFLTRNKNSSITAERLTDLALCAVAESNHELRARLHLRQGLALMLSDTPERLDNFYQLTVRRVFPEWSWEAFQTRVIRLSEILAIRAGLHANVHQYDRERLPKAVELSKVTSEIEDFHERFAESTENAKAFRRHNPVDEDLIERVSLVITANDRMRLDEMTMLALGGDPLFYHLGESLFYSTGNRGGKNSTGPSMQTLLYLREAEKISGMGLDPGKVASSAVKKFVRPVTYA